MILDILADSSRNRVNKAKAKLSLEALKEMIFAESKVKKFNHREDFAFEKALTGNQISFICEVKKASPSKGLIVEDFPYLTIAKEYEEAGAAAISVLTEPEYFKGSITYLEGISKEVNLPVLLKDFITDEYQIYEAKVMGADAILLICTLLQKETIQRYLRICEELGLSALVEAHTTEEVYVALEAGARVIGVNNRNLATFEVDIYNCIHLRKLVPEGILFVAESGIQTDEHMKMLKAANVNGVLIGETLMKSENKKEMLRYLSGF